MIQVASKTDPKNIWREKPRGWFRDFCKGDDRSENGKPEEYDLDKRTTGTMQTEKDNRPKRIQDQLAEEYAKGDFYISAIQSLFPD